MDVLHLDDNYLCLLFCVLSLFELLNILPFLYDYWLSLVLKLSRIKFYAQVILFVGISVEFICNRQYHVLYEIVREDMRMFCVRFLILRNIISLKGVPLFYRTVIFINGSVMYYLRRYGVLIKKVIFVLFVL